MTRRLPWKGSGEERAPNESNAVRSKKEESLELPSIPSPARIALARQTPLRQPRLRQLDSSDPIRSPSTSPPPEVPNEQFMISGDGNYRMVEDELLRVARRFTTHLHRAEYERLKSLARSQNALTIREIERPVVGTPSLEARRRHDRIVQRVKQRSVTGEPETSSRRRQTGLQGLLDAPRLDDEPIAPVPQFISRKRPQVNSTRTRAVDSNLGRSGSSKQRTQSSPALSHATSTPSRQSLHTRHAPISPTVQQAGSPSDTSKAKSRLANLIDDDADDDVDGDDPFGLNQRKIKRHKSREQFRVMQEDPSKREPSPDKMPTFI